ncbi:SGNH/GDSL hydrolase family protein [Algicella marina]|uniref:SGNH hydrolase-type esterase domain-containing protein n=1 Tax=Algicella marina TaxID=2683284 RepID=A0A6P1T3X3_9RHOB|nr:SGNH/GDSL hydrolase family protein [Algicella marina]QHQ36410.1 hypothetical protein GO499_15115 [Algicella marina]
MIGLGLSRDTLAQGRKVSLSGGGPQPPAATPPRTLALYGDSFAQRSQDVTGSPNSFDSGLVTPVSGKWATADTEDVGGVGWGFASWLAALDGRFRTPWQLNFAVGGLNTGQLSQDGTGGNFLGDFATRMQAAQVGALPPHGVIFQAGTNDAVTAFPAIESYNNILAICTRIVALGLPVFLSTVLPRGSATWPGARVDTGRIAVVDELNARLLADLGSEPALAGQVHVVDPRASFRDLGGQANDVIDALTYDGLHLSPAGCRLLALAYAAALETAFPTAQVEGLPTALPDPGNFIANPLMAGIGGTVTMMGNATTNQDFSITGTAPDGWTVRTTNTGITGWNGTDPRNIKGTVTVASVPAAVGDAIEIIVDGDGSGHTNDNTRGLEATVNITLPDTSALPTGSHFEGLCRVELEGHLNCRGVSAELRLTEPDSTTRFARALRPAPNGTPEMELNPATDYTGNNALMLRTPPRARKPGSYGTVQFAVMLYFAGQQSQLQATLRISQAAVRAIDSSLA